MRKRRVIILALLIIAGVILTFISSQSFMILSGQVSGPLPCQSLFAAPVNYFGLGNSGVRALFIDRTTGDMYFSRLVNVGSGLPSLIKITNLGCGGWFGAQSILYWDTATIIGNHPTSFAEDLNQPTHFFELWPGGANIDIIRTAKDGSARTLILHQATTINGLEEIAFDKVNDRAVWSSSQWSTFWRCDRAGANFAAWAPGYRPLAVAVFDDGRLVAFDFNTRSLMLHGAGWGTAVTQQILLPATYGAGGIWTWLSVDNIRNQVHIFRETNEHHGVWDIGTNTFQTRDWTTLPANPRFQGAYNVDWVYVKISGNRMCRYNWTTGVEESWDGSQFLQ